MSRATWPFRQSGQTGLTPLSLLKSLHCCCILRVADEGMQMKLAYENLIDLIWTEGRPPLSEDPIVVHNLTYAGTWLIFRVVTFGAIESSCSRSVSSSSNHIWKECAGPGLGYWKCEISYGWNLRTCGSRYRNLAPLFTSVRDTVGTLPGPRRAANRMEVTWINYVTSYNPVLILIVWSCRTD